ncbi:MAG: vanadium-dependent haloperoxidase [Bacteroidota bacterium]
MNKYLGLIGMVAIFSLSWLACGQQVDPSVYNQAAANPGFYHVAQKDLTDIMVHDIFSPPVASRVYSYCNIAAYEALQPAFPEYKSLAGQLTGLSPVPLPDGQQEINHSLAAMHAFLKMKRKLVFSQEKIEAFETKMYAQYRATGMPEAVFERSIAYGNTVAAHITAWADKDNYKETRTAPRYNVTTALGRWTPTPPDYMDAIEPHWNTIRPFIIDSATQFIPIRPTALAMNADGKGLDENSKFYEELMEVYKAVKERTPETEEIAEFWDCNPFATEHIGHVVYAIKKISPGGHWMGITTQVLRKEEADLMKSVAVYTSVAVALADAFISCWDEKYRSNLIRPETVINEYIDPDWRPLLQTPPFPEYTSGHSVISTAAALTLTNWFGDSYGFADSTEVEFDLPVRSYDSFLAASQEAAVSRLYGGIHYRPAIDQGVAQGEKVGNYVIANLEFLQNGQAEEEKKASIEQAISEGNK